MYVGTTAAIRSKSRVTIDGSLHLSTTETRANGGIATKMSLSGRRAHTWTAQQLHSARRSASSTIPESPRLSSGRELVPRRRPIFHLRAAEPDGKFRYARCRTVIREIKAAPLTCPAFQYVRPVFGGFARPHARPDSAFDFARKGAGRVAVVTFQFVSAGQIYRRPRARRDLRSTSGPT